MLVKEWMSKPVITVKANDSMDKALKLFKQHDVSMLPVMKKGKLVGIITDGDLIKTSASDVKIEKIMTKEPVTVPLDFTVEETAQVLLKHKISGAPVVEIEGKMVGVITQTDILRILISLTGVERRGIQFGFEVEDLPGSVKVLTDTIRNYGGRMASILTSYAMAPKGYRRVYVRMYGIDRFKLNRLKKELKKNTTLLYMVDRREVRRETY